MGSVSADRGKLGFGRLASSAVFPLAVGPVTTVSWPSGNMTVMSRSSKRWSPFPFDTLPIVDWLSTAVAASSDGPCDCERDLRDHDQNLRPFASFVLSFVLSSFFSSTSFHLNEPLRSPRPLSSSSSSSSDGGVRPFLSVETCSSTSSSSRYVAIRSMATPAWRIWTIHAGMTLSGALTFARHQHALL